MTFDIVVPTIGRASLTRLLESLAREASAFAGRIVLVDDRREPREPLDVPAGLPFSERIEIVRSGGRGPAAARNAGWRRSNAEWIVFLDDDVVVDTGWYASLLDDLARCGDRCGGSQGRVRVPLDGNRPATDWERNVAGLESARWITADMAYRRSALRDVGGFDERFRRAYREDSDVALRVAKAGYALVAGSRRTIHPVREADPWISVRLQAGNADDVLMYYLHGASWRERAQAPPGAWRDHAATVAAAAIAAVAAASWAARTARFAWRRIAPGPKDAREIATMLATSVAIPFAACYHRLRGYAAIPAWRDEARGG